jgi:type IX secretion system PorP/SprF family membrane protein
MEKFRETRGERRAARLRENRKGAKFAKNLLRWRICGSLIILLALTLRPHTAKSQQDPMYSQYMFNQMSLNPAYAGSREAMSFTGLFRKQWVGIPGAPMSETFSIHSPTPNDRYGFGLAVMNDRISYLGQTRVDLCYAFRMPLGRGKLALGLDASINQYRINWSKAVVIDQNDIILSNARRLTLPNTGFGVWYNTDRWYVGASVPRILINSLDKNGPTIKLVDATNGVPILKRHFFLMGGYVFVINDHVQFKPSLLFKFVEAAPLEFDLNAELFFYRKFWIGGSYRTGDGLVGMMQFQFTPQLRAGYAYDYPFTRLSNFTKGTHELMLGFDLNFKGESVRSPRFF